MGDHSKSEWTEATWNPVVGCTVHTAGCTNCYAMRLAHRLAAMGQKNYQDVTRMSGGRAKWTGKIRCLPSSLDIPGRWKTGRLIFVNSMSDLFHEDVPEEFILDVFNVMQSTPRHTYQILTKRSDRLKEIWDRLPWPANVWMGVSVENSEVKFRIDDLRNVGASTKFLSLEPLIGPLGELNLQGIDWVITGGESGPHARPMEANWVREIRDQCTASGTAFHFKQWGGVNKKSTGRVLDGRTWDELPARAA